jgi:hypothetical protein
MLALPNNDMQLTALRAAADAKRYVITSGVEIGCV